MTREVGGSKTKVPGKGGAKPKREETIFNFTCEFRTIVGGGFEEGEECVAEYVGDLKVTLAGQDDDDEREYPAGTARLFVVNSDAATNEGHDLFDVLDYRGETAPYRELLGDDTRIFSRPVCRILEEDEALRENFLVLDRLEIAPRFRGQKLGLRWMRAAIIRFGMGCRLAAIKPFPLQFEGKLGTDSVPAPKEMQKECDARRGS